MKIINEKVNNNNTKIREIEKIQLCDETCRFFNARAIMKEITIEKELSDFLNEEAKILQEQSFRDAIY